MGAVVLIANSLWMLGLLIGCGIVYYTYLKYKLSMFGWLSLYFFVSFTYRAYWQIWHFKGMPSEMATSVFVPIGLCSLVAILFITLYKFFTTTKNKVRVS